MPSLPGPCGGIGRGRNTPDVRTMLLSTSSDPKLVDFSKKCVEALKKEIDKQEFSVLSATTKKIGEWSCEELGLGKEAGFVCTRTEKQKRTQTICKGLMYSSETKSCRHFFVESN